MRGDSRSLRRQGANGRAAGDGARLDPPSRGNSRLHERLQPRLRHPNEKMGPACCQPPSAPSEGSAGVRQLDRPEGRSALRSWLTSSGVASGRGSQSEDGFRFLRRPFLDQSAFASPASRGTPRFAQDRVALPAPLPAGPIRSRSFSSSPAGGDRTFRPFLALPVVADAPGRLGLSSRSPIPYEPRAESHKAESAA